MPTPDFRPDSTPLPATTTQPPLPGRPCRYSSDFIAMCDPSESDTAEARRGRVVDDDGDRFYVVWGDDAGSQVEPLPVMKCFIDVDLRLTPAHGYPRAAAPSLRRFFCPQAASSVRAHHPGVSPQAPPSRTPESSPVQLPP